MAAPHDVMCKNTCNQCAQPVFLLSFYRYCFQTRILGSYWHGMKMRPPPSGMWLIISSENSWRGKRCKTRYVGITHSRQTKYLALANSIEPPLPSYNMFCVFPGPRQPILVHRSNTRPIRGLPCNDYATTG